jgi:hypothetical protein
MQTNYSDPKDKNTEDNEPAQRQENEEGLYLVNDDGTDFDSSERTYVSVDLPENEEEAESDKDAEE